MIITMIFHPGGKVAPEQLEQMIRLNIAVHSLALLTVPVLFLGAWGMSRRLDGGDRLAWTGLVLFAFASVAVMNAGTLNGLVAPKLMRLIVAATPETRGLWQAMLSYNFQIEPGVCARVFGRGIAGDTVVVGGDSAVPKLGVGSGYLRRYSGFGDGGGDLFGIIDTGPAWIWGYWRRRRCGYRGGHAGDARVVADDLELQLPDQPGVCARVFGLGIAGDTVVVGVDYAIPKLFVGSRYLAASFWVS